MSSCTETNPQVLRIVSYHFYSKQQMKNQ
ncbi:MAG: hypothetical protein RIS13_463, partial [Bacteroidota bacterium]